MERVIVNKDLISLGELKEHLRIVGNDFDNNLATYLRAAILSAENYTNIIIMPSLFTVTIPFYSTIQLHTRPITEIVKISCDGAEVPAENWKLLDETIHFKTNLSGNITIEFKAGKDPVEDDVKVAILMHAAKLFTSPVDSVETLPTASRNLLAPYKVWSI